MPNVKIGQPDWPNLEEPIAVEHGGWYALWSGGEYNDIYPTEPGPNLDNGVNAVACINTTGDEFDPEDPEEYVKDELKSWVRTDAQYY